jgi:hypothetical protein
MNKLIFVKGTILLILFVCLNTGYSQNGDGALLFKSGFEPDVYITYDMRDIRGSDGMDWQADLEDAIPHVRSFTINFVGGSPNTDAIADLRPDPADEGNTVLYFENLQDGSDYATSRTQNEFNFQREGDTFSKGFMRYRFHLHDNINHLRQYDGRISWFTVMEWWEYRDDSIDGDPAGKSRVTLGINKESGTGMELYWHFDAQKMQPQSQKFDRLWAHENRDVPVPIGEWFLMESFFQPGDNNTGHVWVAITTEGGERQVLFDVHDYTQHPDNPQTHRGWQFFKLYTSGTLLNFMRNADKPVAGYYDDLEYWNDFPPEPVPVKEETNLISFKAQPGRILKFDQRLNKIIFVMSELNIYENQIYLLNGACINIPETLFNRFNYHQTE